MAIGVFGRSAAVWRGGAFKSGIFLGKWHKKLAGLRGKHLGLVIPVTVQG